MLEMNWQVSFKHVSRHLKAGHCSMDGNICVTSVRFSNLIQSTLCVNRVLEKSTELVINILKNKQNKEKGMVRKIVLLTLTSLYK